MSESTNFVLRTAYSLRSESAAITPSQSVFQVTVNQYFAVATATVLVYDALITLDKEVKYFWRTPRNPVDFIYFVIRYVGIVSAIFPLFCWCIFLEGSMRLTIELTKCDFEDNTLNADRILCVATSWVINITCGVIILSIDYILMMRVLALYSTDRRLSICLKLLLLLEVIFKLVMVIYGDILQHVIASVITDNVSICDYGAIPPWRLGLIDWLVPMIYGTILMVLAVCKTKSYWKFSDGFKSTLVKILIRDQIIYFVFTITCCVFNILFFRLQVPNAFLSNVLQCLAIPSFLSIVGSRLLFNLKDAAEFNPTGDTTLWLASRPVDEMDFAEPLDHQESREAEIVTLVDAE